MGDQVKEPWPSILFGLYNNIWTLKNRFLDKTGRHKTCLQQ